MTSTYQHTTLQQLLDRLAVDLADASGLHFTTDERTRAIIESYRMWNLLTAYERATLTFPTVAGTAFYDLSAVGNGSSLLAHTVTDREVVGTCQYRLLEQYDPAAGSGMVDQFSFAELLLAVQSRRDAFLAATEPVVTIGTPTFVSAGTELVDLTDDIVRVVRANWLTLDGTYHPLRGGTDEGVQGSVRVGWRQAPGTPRQWSVASTPNLSLRLVPVPDDGGTLTLMSVNTGPAVNTTANGNTGTVLGVPDDLAAGVGWGAIELLCSKHGDGADGARAQFAGSMYALYVELGRALPSVLTITRNNVPLRVSSLHALDSLTYGWQGRSTSTPRTAAVIGEHLALYPVPDAVYGIDVEVVRRATVPAVGDFIQLGREQLAAVLAWAKQLCMFKSGGIAIQQGQQAAGTLIAAARTYNEARIADSQYLIELLSTGTDSPVPIARTPIVNLPDTDPRDTASSRNSRAQSTNYARPTPRLGGR